MTDTHSIDQMDLKEPIPAGSRALLIGRGGQNIKAIQEATGARIQVPRPSDNETEDDTIDVTVTGNTVSIAQACRMIRDKIGERSSKSVTPVKDIPSVFYHFIAGPNNVNVESLQKAHDVEITVPEYDSVCPTGSLPEKGNERTIFYAPSAGSTFITISGQRPGIQAARDAIENHASELHSQLQVQQDQGLERNLVQYLFETSLSMPAFYAETGCVLMFPEDEADAAIRIVGPDNLAIQSALNLCEERSTDLHSGKVDMRTFGGDQCCWNVARYLRDCGELSRLETDHNVRFVTPMTLQGATAWDIYAKEHKRLTDARREASQIANAFPGARMRNIVVNDFFYHHIRQYLKPEVKLKYGVKTVIPTPKEKKQGTDVLLVYEGLPDEDGPFRIPRATSKPPASELPKFKKALDEAENHIQAFVKSQGIISTIPVDVPPEYQEKLRNFIKKEQDVNRSRDMATVRASNSGKTVKFSGPKDSVEGLVAKVHEFIMQEERYDRERDFKLSFDFPQKFANHLIGKGGQNIASLREKFDVDIQVKEGTIDVKGPQAKAEKARSYMQSFARELADETTHVFKVDPKYHASIIGAQGSKIRRLETNYKVHINFTHTKREMSPDQENESGATKPRKSQKADEVIVRGPKKGADAARDEILSLLNYLQETGHQATVTVKRKQLGSLIGSRGKVLDDIRQTTSARIEVQDVAKEKGSGDEDVEIHIQGTQESVQAAKKAILEKKAIFDSMIVENIEVDRKHHRALIGTNGNTIRDIIIKAGGPESRQESARLVRFPQQASYDNVIKVEGRQPVVEKIVAAIKEIVAERETQVTDSVDVPMEKHRGLIGRGGDKKRDMETQFKVTINIPRQGDGRTDVKITGQPADVEKAKAHIEALVKEQQGETFQVPRKLHHTISNNGRFFRDVRSKYNVNIDHAGQKVPPKPTATASQTDAPLITDQDKGDDGTAHRWTVTKASTQEGEIPWNLRGAPENVVKVKELLLKEMEKAKTLDTKGTLDMGDTSCYRYVIGAGGKTIEFIRQETGCDIQVPRSDEDKGISIFGSADGVEKAKELILTSVREGKASRRE